MNKVSLLGFLASIPKEEFLPSGIRVTKFSLVTKEFAKDKLHDSFHKIVAWGDLGDELKMRNIGSKCFVEGKLKTRSWDKDGVKHYMTEVIATDILCSSVESKPALRVPPKTIPTETFNEDDMPF